MAAERELLILVVDRTSNDPADPNPCAWPHDWDLDRLLDARVEVIDYHQVVPGDIIDIHVAGIEIDGNITSLTIDAQGEIADVG